nr:DUF3793 family protein [uncultured Mediterraneibacter sp.]
MPSEVLTYFLKNSDWKVRLEFQIALQCAPFLKGLKVSCVISLNASLCRGLGEMFRGSDIAYRRLSCSEGKCLVLFYRPEELERHLNGRRTRRLIREYGYENMSFRKMLERLSDRVSDFAERGIGFPHEIGAFLGYPPEDVKGFIENEGRKYLMIGYWKVYSDLTHARMVFKEYDRAKACAVNEFLTGKSIREIAV